MKTRQGSNKVATRSGGKQAAVKKALRVQGIRKPAAAGKLPAAASRRHTRAAAAAAGALPAAVTRRATSKTKLAKRAVATKASAATKAPVVKRSPAGGRQRVAPVARRACYVSQLDDATLAEIFAAVGNQKMCRCVLMAPTCC